MMMMEVAEGSSARMPVSVVYLFGCKEDKELWYRVELPMTPKEEKRKREDSDSIPHLYVHPAGKINGFNDGFRGGWTVNGNNIYRIGAFNEETCQRSRSLVKGLFKHNISRSDPTSWEKVSSSNNIHRWSPYLATFVNGKICVVSGAEYRYTNEVYPWKQCGEIYDINKKSWEFIDVNYKDICSYSVFTQIAQDVENPTKIVFYCLYSGSMMVMDVGNNSKDPIVYPAEFDLWRRSDPPKGLVDCDDVSILKLLTGNAVAVLADGTFYWCTQENLRLYGYDANEEKWLRSQSLEKHFPPIYFEDESPYYPILLGLGNGKFVLVLPIKFGQSIMAIITVHRRVDKRRNSLGVSVDQRHYVCYDDHHFLPRNGKAMLKSTGSGSMH